MRYILPFGADSRDWRCAIGVFWEFSSRPTSSFRGVFAGKSLPNSERVRQTALFLTLRGVLSDGRSASQEIAKGCCARHQDGGDRV
jgi:hypothetical protein